VFPPFTSGPGDQRSGDHTITINPGGHASGYRAQLWHLPAFEDSRDRDRADHGVPDTCTSAAPTTLPTDGALLFYGRA
jgi:hypothetical protein